MADGRVYAWGYNAAGELGNGTSGSSAGSTVPVAVSATGVLAGRTVTTVAGGRSFSLAIADGRAFAWGSNIYGQLGTGTTSDASLPVAVSTAGGLAGKTVTALSAGQYHALAVADGRAYAWGNNQYGKLGNGSSTDSSVPVAVSTAGVLDGRTVTSVSGGRDVCLAVADGQVFAWGRGILGDGTTGQSSVPVAVSTDGVLGGKTATAIAAGITHSLAVADGKVYSWGANDFGQLGDGSIIQRNTPVAVSSTVLNGLTVTQVAAGYQCSFALSSDGHLFAWGNNIYGEIGVGATGGQFTTPQEVPPPVGFAWASIDTDTQGLHVVATAGPPHYEPVTG